MYQTEVVHPKHGSPYLVTLVPSTSSDKFYRVDVVNHRCDCPSWKFQKGERKPCKHLRSLGFSAASAEIALSVSHTSARTSAPPPLRLPEFEVPAH
jgi:hypothetical protein